MHPDKINYLPDEFLSFIGIRDYKVPPQILSAETT